VVAHSAGLKRLSCLFFGLLLAGQAVPAAAGTATVQASATIVSGGDPASEAVVVLLQGIRPGTISLIIPTDPTGLSIDLTAYGVDRATGGIVFLASSHSAPTLEQAMRVLTQSGPSTALTGRLSTETSSDGTLTDRGVQVLILSVGGGVDGLPTVTAIVTFD
jgi:hypothetical protein